MAERITDRLVKELTPPTAGNRIIYDEKVKGFGVRITAGGARAFVLNYRNAEGIERRLTIGAYGPNEWSVEAARKRAGEFKKMIANGFKMEVEAMISKDLEYLTEHYVPMKLKDKKQWLD